VIPFTYNWRSLLQRPVAALSAAFALALAVFVNGATLMLWHSVERSTATVGSERNVILLGRGASTESTSRISETQARLLETFDELETLEPSTRGAGELVVTTRLSHEGASEPATIRGVTPMSFDVRAGAEVSEGRMLQFGGDEILVGRLILERLRRKGLVDGSSLALSPARTFRIVGVLSARGTSFENEIWMDLQTARAFFSTPGELSVYTGRLRQASDWAALKARVESDPRLDLVALRETDYYAEQTRELGWLLQGIAFVLSAILAAGAVLGATATMYALIGQRTREIGTLKALGFERVHILASFLVETCALSCAAGIAGMLASWAITRLHLELPLGADGDVVVFAFVSSPAVFVSSFALALGLGLASGFLPAVFASRISPMEAIRHG
jgi:ABC-type antimicrobial peptide transport system permease subunit